MSSSSSTAPEGPRSLRQLWFPLLLLAVWTSLAIFGVVAYLDPPWLQRWSKPGVATEAQSFVDWGDARARAGDFERALHWYRRALALEPDSVRATLNAAVALGRLGRGDEALRSLEALAERAPKRRRMILYNLAELHLRGKDWARARDRYREALAAGAWPQLVLARLGDVYLELGQPDQARAALDEAIRRWQDPTTAYRNALYQALESSTEDTEGLPALEALAAREPTTAELARYDLDGMRTQLARDPELARLLARLGRVELKLGDRDAAREHLDRSLKIWPANPDAASHEALLRALGG